MRYQMGPLSVQIEPQTPIRRSKRRRELDDQLDREEKAAEPDHVETAGIEADVAPPKKARPHRKKAPKRRRGLVVKADPTDPSLLIPFGPAMAAKVLQKRGRGALSQKQLKSMSAAHSLATSDETLQAAREAYHFGIPPPPRRRAIPIRADPANPELLNPK